MFNTDITRRLENLEEKIQKHDDQTAKSAIVEAELSSQIKELASFLKEFVHKEETFMKEQRNREKDSYLENTKILEKIRSDIHTIKSDLSSQPKDMEVLLLKQKDEIKDYCRKTFATNEELTEGLSSIRKQAKLLWVVIMAGLAGTAWIIDEITKLANLTNIGK